MWIALSHWTLGFQFQYAFFDRVIIVCQSRLRKKMTTALFKWLSNRFLLNFY